MTHLYGEITPAWSGYNQGHVISQLNVASMNNRYVSIIIEFASRTNSESILQGTEDIYNPSASSAKHVHNNKNNNNNNNYYYYY